MVVVRVGCTENLVLPAGSEPGSIEVAVSPFQVQHVTALRYLLEEVRKVWKGCTFGIGSPVIKGTVDVAIFISVSHGLYIDIHGFIGVQTVNTSVHGIHREAAPVADLKLIRLSAPGSDNYHPVCTAGSIDRCC